MPCDTIQLNRVTFDITKLNVKLLTQALTDIGATSIVIQQGRATFIKDSQRFSINGGDLVSRADNVGEVADNIRKAYSTLVVKLAAHQNGWTVQQTGPFAYNILRI